MIYINGRFLTHNIAGIPRFSYEMCKVLTQTGVDITVVVPESAPRKDYPFPVTYYGKKKNHLWEQVDLYRFMKKKNGALLISFSGLGPVRYSNHIPTIHDLSFWQHPQWFSLSYNCFYKLMTPVLAKRAVKIITVSRFSKKEIIDFLNVPEEKIEIIPNAVSSALCAGSTAIPPENQDLAAKYILMVSARDPRKNFSRAVQAFLSLNRKDIQLYIVGDSGTVFKEKKMIDFDHPSIKLLGRISDEALSFYYAHALLFVYPSLYEGFGIPPLEAMANGCPVLVSDIEPLREVCGNAAYYCDPNDTSSIAEGMEIVLDNESFRQQLIDAANQQVKKYSWDISAQKIKTLLA